MAVQVSQHDGCRLGRFGDLVEQGPDVRRSAVESPENIALIGHPEMTLNTLDHDKLLQLVPVVFMVSDYGARASRVIKWRLTLQTILSL